MPTSKQRAAIASLKDQLAALSKQATKPVEPTVPGVSDKEKKKARFSGKLIRSLRTKLGLTRDQFGKLIGVTGYAVKFFGPSWSGQTIYCWECVPRVGGNGVVLLR